MYGMVMPVVDWKLVINQVVGEWKTRDEQWIPYQELAEGRPSLTL